MSTPVNYDATKKYPLLVVVHGGPAWASFPIYSDYFNGKYPIEQFIEKGLRVTYSVYMVKPVDMDEVLMRVGILLRRPNINNDRQLYS